MKRAGTLVPDNDLWIAALAMEYEFAVILSAFGSYDGR